MRVVTSIVTGALALVLGVQALAASRKAPEKSADPGPGIVPCTTNGLVHGEVSAEITQRVTSSITLLDKYARLRDVAKLTLPCGFTIEGRWTANLFLTNGIETRRYFENNSFGFSLPYGPGDQAGGAFDLKYEAVDVKALWPTGCPDALKSYAADFQLCASFGSDKSFFGVSARGDHHLLAHYLVGPSGLKEDFKVAETLPAIKTIFFLPPPDADGGTITLIMEDRGELYRAFIDVSHG
ncbi:MAG: hypothetical protein V4459_06110 [Pseudomonadota bacterium]